MVTAALQVENKVKNNLCNTIQDLLVILDGIKSWVQDNTFIKEVKDYKIKIKSDNIRGSLNKFPDFFRMSTFIDTTHMKL